MKSLDTNSLLCEARRADCAVVGVIAEILLKIGVLNALKRKIFTCFQFSYFAAFININNKLLEM